MILKGFMARYVQITKNYQFSTYYVGFKLIYIITINHLYYWKNNNEQKTYFSEIFSFNILNSKELEIEFQNINLISIWFICI